MHDPSSHADTARDPSRHAIPASASVPAADVAVLAPAPGPYSYAIPADLADQIRPGKRVMVPLAGRSQVEGVVLRLAPPPPGLTGGLKPIVQVLPGPPLPAELLSLVDFVSDYYLAPQGEALRLILPPHEQMDVRDQLSLTPAGVTLAGRCGLALLPPDVAALSSLQQAILARLAAELRRPGRRRKTVALADLRKLLRAGDAAPDPSPDQLRVALRELQAGGWLAVTQEVARQVVAREELWVQASAEGCSEAVLRQIERGTVRAALWRHVVRFGPLPLPDLRTLSPNASMLVKQLEKLGAVTVSVGGPADAGGEGEAARAGRGGP
ncbi:MAG TPA: hypothetical protein PKI03_34215, partial [Pseudomonadota bacterium]|nr:hypothetical protein [Pseudomonadota bacterium]